MYDLNTLFSASYSSIKIFRSRFIAQDDSPTNENPPTIVNQSVINQVTTDDLIGDLLDIGDSMASPAQAPITQNTNIMDLLGDVSCLFFHHCFYYFNISLFYEHFFIVIVFESLIKTHYLLNLFIFSLTFNKNNKCSHSYQAIQPALIPFPP